MRSHLEILGKQSTTAHLNFVTWNKAYCLFPCTTLKKQEAYLIKALDDFVADVLGDFASATGQKE
jgi:hypothetical protein